MPKTEKIEFNYSKLRGRIIEKYGTLSNFADKLGVSLVTLSNKMNNVSAFSQDEIYACCLLLDIQDNSSYFFEPNVQK